jgi:hypothetical protein
MAHRSYAQLPTADNGGMNHQDRKPMHDTTANTHRSDRRSASPDAALGSTHHTDGRGGEQSATEGAAEDDDEEDSSAAKDNELDDDETDADVPALPYGYGKGGKGKGKRPSIRVEPVDDDESHGEDDETTSHGTENLLMSSKHPVNQLLMSDKKRTFSNLSSTSVLFGDELTDQESFPRRKMARKEEDEAQVNYENAIESDDEDYSGVNLVPDDDDDMNMMERMEESFILQEEQQATTLLNEYTNRRRFSLDSCMSDHIFDVTAPLDDTYMSSLPGFGFSQFFEPEALPASPVPIAKRKFSDGSAKRVRFDDDVQVSDSSSSASSELDSSVFPDLFLDQDKIPPILSQLLNEENDGDNGDMASQTSEGSFWDFEQNESRITQVDHSDDDNESSGESGYECTVVPYRCFYSLTNIPSQLTWVILPMKKTSASTSCHEPQSKRVLFYDDHLQPRAPERPLPSLLSAIRARLDARSHPLVAFSYTAKLIKPLPSLTGRLKRLFSIVRARP